MYSHSSKNSNKRNMIINNKLKNFLNCYIWNDKKEVKNAKFNGSEKVVSLPMPAALFVNATINKSKTNIPSKYHFYRCQKIKMIPNEKKSVI